MTIAQTLKQYSNKEIEILLGHVLQQSKEFLYMNPEFELNASEEEKLANLAKQRQDGMPIAYLTSTKHFYGLNFKVSKHTLIPRPETEWLVEEALRLIAKRQKISGRKTLRILDVGTGSGAIAVSIAFNSDPTKVQLFASDISDKALGTAKQNAKLAKTDIVFYKSDLLKNVKGKFDIIIANLPYVPVSDYKKFYENLKHEPKLALTDGTEDFILVKKLVAQLGVHLNKDGVALLEVDPKTIAVVREQIKSLKFIKKMRVVKDIHNLERFIILS